MYLNLSMACLNFQPCKQIFRGLYGGGISYHYVPDENAQGKVLVKHIQEKKYSLPEITDIISILLYS